MNSMRNIEIPPLYQRYFIDRSDERRILFEKITALYRPQRGIYPGSFVHITPSFYIKDMTYIDSDKRIKRFFADENVMSYIESNKLYSETAVVNGIQADYSAELPLENNTFDIMFSFYAGFISQSCKKYLKSGGVLVCNNSHGDASIASLDREYELTGVVKRNGNRFSITNKDLHTYFIKKDGSAVDRVKVESRMTGERFTRKGYAYVFKYTHRK